MRSIHGLLLSSAFALALTGCATGAAEHSGAAFPRRAGVLTASEVQPHQDVHRAILVLRRHWLTGRSSNPSARPLVLVDGLVTSGIDALSAIPGHRVLEVRYLPANEASIRFAGGGLDGAILVTTKH